MRFAHINIITDNWKRLSDFYINVFDCTPVLPKRDLKGDWLDKATDIQSAHIRGIHLALPGYGNKGPTLEIFQYAENNENLESLINRKGYGHLAFEVADVEDVVSRLLDHGGTLLGEIVETKIPDAGTLEFVYAKDNDGNIIEIQKWNIERPEVS